MKKKWIWILFAIMLLTTSACAANSVQTDSGTAATVTDSMLRADEEAVDLPEYLPLDVQMKTEGDVKLLVKKFEVSPDVEPQQLIESDLRRDGAEYVLHGVLRESLPDSAEQQTARQVVTVSGESDEREDILKLLPEFIDYAENGFTGQLALDADSISTEVESTGRYAYTIKDSREFYGLNRNDPYNIPKTATKNGVVLTLEDIQWRPETAGNEQFPIYSATAYYTGKGYGSAPDSYLVTAQYSGVVEKAIPGNVQYTIIYEAVSVSGISDLFVWGKAGKISLLVIAACGFAVLAMTLLRKFGLPKRRKVAAVEFADDQAESEARPERRKPHALGYMRRVTIDE